MKPSPKYDFPVSVRCQSWEEEPKVASLYEGIFDVILNHTISVMFVPEFIREFDYLLPTLPKNTDEISTELDARLVTVAISRYIVTPAPLLGGQEELILQKNDLEFSQSRVLFFVTSQEFNIFSSELSILAQQIPTVHTSRKISAFKDYNFAELLLSRIIHSKYFADKDRQLLERNKVYLSTS